MCKKISQVMLTTFLVLGLAYGAHAEVKEAKEAQASAPKATNMITAYPLQADVLPQIPPTPKSSSILYLPSSTLPTNISYLELSIIISFHRKLIYCITTAVILSPPPFSFARSTRNSTFSPALIAEESVFKSSVSLTKLVNPSLQSNTVSNPSSTMK